MRVAHNPNSRSKFHGPKLIGYNMSTMVGRSGRQKIIGYNKLTIFGGSGRKINVLHIIEITNEVH